MPANLYIVPTPIGNLDDITLRAIETLNTVDLVACEDTRHSSKLLQHFNISTDKISLHQHNESQRSAYLVALLKQGKSIALISDAGTPLINDPGYELVNLCRQSGICVTALPGPCAFVTALSSSGFPTDKLCFAGFFPLKQQARLQALEEIANTSTTYVFYEAPRRILATMQLIAEHYPTMQAMIAKELTKTHENYIGTNAGEIVSWLSEDAAHQKGEFVLILRTPRSASSEDIPADAMALLKLLAAELPKKTAAKVVAEHYSLNKKSLYNALL